MRSGNKTMLGVPWHLQICTQVGCPGMRVWIPRAPLSWVVIMSCWLLLGCYCLMGARLCFTNLWPYPSLGPFHIKQSLGLHVVIILRYSPQGCLILVQPITTCSPPEVKARSHLNTELWTTGEYTFTCHHLSMVTSLLLLVWNLKMGRV